MTTLSITWHVRRRMTVDHIDHTVRTQMHTISHSSKCICHNYSVFWVRIYTMCINTKCHVEKIKLRYQCLYRNNGLAFSIPLELIILLMGKSVISIGYSTAGFDLIRDVNLHAQRLTYDR